jgi:hypothetical protein
MTGFESRFGFSGWGGGTTMKRILVLGIILVIACAAAAHSSGTRSAGVVPDGLPEGSTPRSGTDANVYCLLLEGGFGAGSGDLTATCQDFLANMYGVAFDTVDCNTVTPSVGDLLVYDAVLLWENGTFSNAPNVGLVIHDYVTNYDGDVVFGTFIWQDWTTWGGFGWDIMEGICPLTEAGACEYNYDELDPASIVPHPVTAGVLSLWCTMFHGGTTVQPGATGLARWSDQVPAIAVDTQGGRMAAISIFPSYENWGNYGVEFGGDFHRLFENALKWAAGKPAVALNVVPDAVFYSPGGSLGYTAILANQTSSPQTFWGRVTADVPGVGQVVVVSPMHVTLPPNAFVQKHMAHPIPNAAPLGTYTVTVTIGTPPANVWDEDSFQFEMVP